MYKASQEIIIQFSRLYICLQFKVKRLMFNSQSKELLYPSLYNPVYVRNLEFRSQINLTNQY